jgi:hypothetical protein
MSSIMKGSSVWFRCLCTLIMTAITSLPFDFWWVVYKFVSPDGFFQKAVLFGFGVWFLGGLQFVLLICFIASLVTIWE